MGLSLRAFTTLWLGKWFWNFSIWSSSRAARARATTCTSWTTVSKTYSQTAIWTGHGTFSGRGTREGASAAWASCVPLEPEILVETPEELPLQLYAFAMFGVWGIITKKMVTTQIAIAMANLFIIYWGNIVMCTKNNVKLCWIFYSR
jgi:hypothetical protein